MTVRPGVDLVAIADATPTTLEYASQLGAPHNEGYERMLDAVRQDDLLSITPADARTCPSSLRWWEPRPIGGTTTVGAKRSSIGKMSAFPYRQTAFFNTAAENIPAPCGQALR